MKLVRWLRFTWDLGKIPAAALDIEPQYTVRRAERTEAKVAQNVLVSAFTLDSDWNDTLHTLRDVFEEQIEAAFDQKEVPVLLLSRGNRVVGASVLDFDADSSNHLVSGPAIVNEYRNRGLGAALLYASLRTLQEAGLTTAHGVTKDNVPTAKFLYTKFDATSAPFEMLARPAEAGS